MSRILEKDHFFRAPVERVWQALTTPSEMSLWLGMRVVELDLQPGGILKVEGLHPGEITAVEAPRKLAWAWDPENGTEPGRETITLHAEEGGTRLHLHSVSIGRWADDRLYFGGNEAGWENWLEDLAALVDEGKVSAPEGPNGSFQFGLKAEADGADRDRLSVKSVVPGGAAEAAGLAVGDLLVAWDGQPLDRASAWWKRAWRTSPGQKVRLSVRRGDSAFEAEVVLAAPKRAS
jgi:uncharacterized protein YndB with AHSA1/START domain